MLQARRRDRRYLRKWRNNQRTARLSGAQRTALESLGLNLDESPYKEWDVRLEESRRITESLGRLPKTTDVVLGARSAYSWLRGQLRLPADDPRRALLDRALPGWDMTRDSLWEQKLSLAVAYLAAHNRMPSQCEKSCGTWLSAQKRRTTPARRAELDRRLPGWDKTPEDKWTDALNFVSRYYTEHGRLPSGASDDPEIKYHGDWISGQKRSRSADPARTARLNAAIPGWQALRDLDQLWQGHFDQCLAFVAKHGRLPGSGKTSIDSEQRLFRWIGNQRHKSTPDRQALLDQKLPGWRGNREGAWEQLLSECVAFLVKTGRLPGEGSAATPSERKLSGWMRTQRRLASATRQAVLDEKTPGWRGHIGRR